ncbi:sperm acrosome developmental regulator isoform X1 [Triplophysa rosa]|uniref:TSC22 domain family protein 4 n=1 Tax=Triplophysa rosa TaxID=992332 RepID=A0A9W7WEB2_TRIRA|nr:sperm acrosome developmental regulator isoform X1 [Triplophysa rosa]XP_057175648.1 sperm acrosome developmental regulator isoform X1 [Triplophysa rosa]XP_057175649.1 sperm acrosome developmental regulator isoform X1 [Triplophysa rosa]XP_057175650.1 sperm acrosome developmental regulator isoform X1 [Triplophysa rosa]XP_057175651.1 sperm acrosome developmental regulator isoform X1 [Triplophysa rosa]KAI7794658.1 putative TSC22 domain family protein 4 [Triplophysa rosa]
MSGGKKRSGFQITSVTSDYNQGSSENLSPKGPAEILSPHKATPPSTAHRSQTSSPTQIVANGPSLRQIPALQTQQSSSQPTTPLTARKQNSLDAGGASRFRVVRLDQGLGEPYKRGRWTCVDVIEREVEERGLRRVIDSMRHAHSLESLETVGLGGAEGAVGGAGLKPLGVRGLQAGHMVHSQGTTHLLVQCRTETAHSGPPSPTRLYAPHDTLQITPPHVQNTPRARNIPAPLRLDVDATGKLRTTRSQPASPGPYLCRDSPFHPGLTPIQTPSTLALAQSMFGMGRAFELVGDDSGTNTSMIAIDNKIEQAMDLVKSHLMLAVREEVEILREQIKELSERNAQLERENYILRALKDRD